MFLRDIVRYEAEYKTRVIDPVEVIIKQSRPFPYAKSKDNAEFFKPVSKLVYYIVSGQTRTGYLATGRWNKCYIAVLGQKINRKKRVRVKISLRRWMQ